MTTLKPHPVSGRTFTWRGRHGFAEMSEVGGFGRVYDDACDEGLTVVSSRTGREVVFVVDSVERDADGDIRSWTLVPVGPVVVRGPKGVTLTVYND